MRLWLKILSLGLLFSILGFEAMIPTASGMTRIATPPSAKPRTHTPGRFGYVQEGHRLPGGPKKKVCYNHGMARCMGKKSLLKYESRYTNRMWQESLVHPRLRGVYKTKKTVQNF